MNRSLLETGGELLAVSQFTLLADCRKGRRPSFIEAAEPRKATDLYEQFVNMVRAKGVTESKPSAHSRSSRTAPRADQASR